MDKSFVNVVKGTVYQRLIHKHIVKQTGVVKQNNGLVVVCLFVFNNAFQDRELVTFMVYVLFPSNMESYGPI